ncbi:polysaccharide biosynthesis protein [Candidatus Pelagibacter sp.]|nr:polysaccharide biosynthesis protein [Candidatus Pelagibacter sp.]
MKTIILGKQSLLSKYLCLKNKKNIVFSARGHASISSIVKEIKNSKKVNLILNNFFPSNKISDITEKEYEKFYDQSILFNAKLFSKLDGKNINKIIYSSSSSVYNSIRKDYQFKDTNNKSLYSSTKIAAENLIYNFASKNNIPFLILRIFNMYSEKDDKFSIVSKLLKSINRSNEIKLYNGGENIRDFIHVKDVVKLINYFIKKKNLKRTVYDIGIGKGVRLKDLINFIGKEKFNIKNTKTITDEVDVSIANIEEVENKNFTKLENFFSKYSSNKKKKLEYKTENTKNILQDIIEDYIIYGTGNAGKQVFQRLAKQNRKVFCFVDDNPKKHSQKLYGKKIISRKEFIILSKIKIINHLIIAIPSIKKQKLQKIREIFYPYVNEITYVPLKNTLKSEIISLSDLDNFETNEILKKKQKVINFKVFSKELNSKNILVTGAAGSIGSQMVRQLLNTSVKKIIGYDNSEIDLFNLKNELKEFKKINLYLGDILDEKFLNYIIEKEKINFIYHAAAYKHVGILENNIESAIRNNIFGTESVLKCAQKNTIPIVTISTDKAVKPTSILGLTKRVSEILCLEYNTQSNPSKVVRFGNVFGSMGSVVPTFINQINQKVPITITDKKVKRYFMTLNDATYLLLWSIKIKKVNNILVLNMGKPIKILDIIKSLVKVRRTVDPNYSYKIEEIGLQKGEKMTEELTINNKTIKTKHPDIKLATDPIYTSYEINNLLNDLKEINDPNILKKKLKNFLLNEFN